MLAADLKARQRSMLERMLENLGAAAPHPPRKMSGSESRERAKVENYGRKAERVERPWEDADGEVCPEAVERWMRWKQMEWGGGESC